MAPAAISKPDLFAALAAGHAAGITVVTPNRRLAQALRADFDAYQASRNKTVWEDADILPLDAFVQRRYEDALYSDDAASGGEPLPMLLSEAQQRELWVGAIEGSKWAGALLDVPRTAAHAMEAWRLAHAWGIAGAAFSGAGKDGGNEDTRAFAEWAKAYARRLKKDGLIDTALLFDVSFNVKKPKRLVGYAFDIVPAQARALFGRFDFLECRPERKQGKPLRASFQSPREELEAAAAWARGRLEAGAKRIGVVVPDLDRRRREVARVFARVLGQVMGSDAPFNLSVGEPLADYPLVSFALSLLEFTTGEIEFERVSRILRSPFLGGAEKERGARALADARLREQAPAALTLARVIGMLKEGPLRQRLENVFQTENQDKSPHGWARHYTALLEAAGFPGERALDSAEFQARAKFNEVLGEFARLSLVNSKFPEKKAVQELRRLCADTPFQPERAEAPVQVLGLLESAGQEFDALWVSGLTDEQWPQRARPHPFLPLALQRRAQIPNASPEASLALDRQRTQDWLGAASEVVLSWARREEDRDLLPSPLIAGIAEGAPEIPTFVSWREKIFRAGRTETFADEEAPPVKERSVRGGTRVLANQAACPFRAFARHRLRAEALEEPAPGPDAMERGQLLHALMANLWKLLGSSASLQNDVSPQIEQAAKSAVAGLGLQGRLAALEVARLRRLAGEWLDLERERPPFAVVAIERKVALEVAGLEMQGRIDRMDRLLEGEMRDTHAVIDYKTGARVTPKDWDGARPDDPQLPLYAIALPLPISATAFAKLRAGDMKFSGFSAAKDAIPGVKPALDWAAMTGGWKSALEALARDFSAGRAEVDPKRGLATCRNCDLHTLCRVHERLDALGTDEEEGE